MIFTFCTTQSFEHVLCLIIIIISSLSVAASERGPPWYRYHLGSLRPNILNLALILSPIGVTTHSSYVMPDGVFSPS
jgi:hypothetical protein